MFFNNFVKLARDEWTQIKKDYNEMIQEIRDQKAIIKSQSKEIEKLMKYKDKDDLLYSYETSNEDQRNIIKALEQELDLSNAETEVARKRLDAEKLVNDLMVKKLGSGYMYSKLETVSIIDIKG